jgi:hypothetical protein
MIALGNSKFSLTVDPIKMLDSTKWLPQRVGPMLFTNVKGAAKAKELQKEFEAMNAYSKAIAFKFIVGSPMIACVVESDSYSIEQI